MGNDLLAYRASIGNFYSKIYSPLIFKKYSYYFCHFFILNTICKHFVNSINLLSYKLLRNTGNTNVTFLFLIILSLISQQSDIEKNPGPLTDNSSHSDSTDINNINRLTILHLNIRSIRNKLNSILDFADGINILCFTETHLDDNVNTSELVINNYEIPYRLDRTNHGGGLLAYIAKGIMSCRRPDLENKEDEVIWFEVTLNSAKFLVSVVYRPPNTPQSFWNRFERSLSLALDETNHVTVVGDLNIDFLLPLPTSVSDILNSQNLTNIITEPTRITDTRKSLLDPILISNSIKVIEQGTIPVQTDISDHEATFAVFTTPTGIKSVFTKEIWLYHKCNVEALRNDIKSTDWATILNNNQSTKLASNSQKSY